MKQEDFIKYINDNYEITFKQIDTASRHLDYLDFYKDKDFYSIVNNNFIILNNKEQLIFKDYQEVIEKLKGLYGDKNEKENN